MADDVNDTDIVDEVAEATDTPAPVEATEDNSLDAVITRAQEEHAEEPAAPEPEITEPEPTPALEAPETWDDDEKTAFSSWSQDVQKTVLDRFNAWEETHTQQSEEYAQLADATIPILEGLAPHEEYLTEMSQTLNTTTGEMLSGLLKAEQTLRRGTPQEKVQTALHMLQSYGIPISYLTGQQPIPQAPPTQQQPQNQIVQDPRVDELLQEREASQIREAEGMWQNFKSMKDEQGRDMYPRAEQWAPHMRTLLTSGQASTYEEAYAIATEPVKDLLRQAVAPDPQAVADVEKAKRASSPKTSSTRANGGNKPQGLDAHISFAMGNR